MKSSLKNEVGPKEYEVILSLETENRPGEQTEMFLNRRRLLAKYEETANGTAGAIFSGQER